MKLLVSLRTKYKGRCGAQLLTKAWDIHPLHLSQKAVHLLHLEKTLFGKSCTRTGMKLNLFPKGLEVFRPLRQLVKRIRKLTQLISTA
jgi:hypothetical protein